MYRYRVSVIHFRGAGAHKRHGTHVGPNETPSKECQKPRSPIERFCLTSSVAREFSRNNSDVLGTAYVRPVLPVRSSKQKKVRWVLEEL